MTTKIGLRDSAHMVHKEQVGIQTSGYITKKGGEISPMQKLNKLPPGMDISNQDMADIREMPMKKLTDLSYPGDGWTGD